MHSEVERLRSETAELRKELGKLRERVAWLEGLLEGLTGIAPPARAGVGAKALQASPRRADAS